jgi:chemotaxis protein MotB
MSRSARSRQPVGHRSAVQDRWLVSYADFITLMFAFFTVMYAVSTVDDRKMTPAATSIQAAFSIATPSVPAAADVTTTAVDDLEEVRRRLSLELTDAIDSKRLDITRDARGLVLSLPVEATFATGSADVQSDARVLLGRIATVLRPLDNGVRIEGHTDDVPIRTARYGSNWELSTARASAVVAFLIESARFEPARLSAAGYAEFHPRVANDSADNRASNRRVDVVVLNPASKRDEPAAGVTR